MKEMCSGKTKSGVLFEMVLGDIVIGKKSENFLFGREIICIVENEKLIFLKQVLCTAECSIVWNSSWTSMPGYNECVLWMQGTINIKGKRVQSENVALKSLSTWHNTKESCATVYFQSYT